MNTKESIYDKLQSIYQKHRKKYKNNPDSMQMCCMWSTSNPPDTIEDTEPFDDIEEAFDITIRDEDCFELYDMEIEEAVIKIHNIIKQKC